MLAVAWLAHGMLAGRNPRWRVALWRSAVVGVAMVAVLSAAPPIVKYHVVTDGEAAVEVATDRPAAGRCRIDIDSSPVTGRMRLERSRSGSTPMRSARAGRYSLDCDGCAATEPVSAGRRPRPRASRWGARAGLVVGVDLAGRRPRPDGPADRGEPEPGPARPAVVGGPRRDRSRMPGDRRATGMSSGLSGSAGRRRSRRPAWPGLWRPVLLLPERAVRRRATRRTAGDPRPRAERMRGITTSPGTSRPTSPRSCSGSTRWPGGFARRMRRRVTRSAMPWPPTCSATWPRTAGRWRGWRCGRPGRRQSTGWPWPALRTSAAASMP